MDAGTMFVTILTTFLSTSTWLLLIVAAPLLLLLHVLYVWSVRRAFRLMKGSDDILFDPRSASVRGMDNWQVLLELSPLGILGLLVMAWTHAVLVGTELHGATSVAQMFAGFLVGVLFVVVVPAWSTSFLRLYTPNLERWFDYACRLHNFYECNRTETDHWYHYIIEKKGATLSSLFPRRRNTLGTNDENALARAIWRLPLATVRQLTAVAGGHFPHHIFLTRYLARVKLDDNHLTVTAIRRQLVDELLNN